MSEKKRRYEGGSITVRYEPRRCLHVGECVRGLPEVFDPDAKPWVQPDSGAADEVARTVQRCPTGALTYQRHDGGPEEEPGAVNTVRIQPTGPLYLSGRLRLQIADGGVIEETRMALCRCGASRNKPFCDNSHRDADFADDGREVERDLTPADPTAGDTLTISLLANGPAMLAGPFEIVDAEGATTRGAKAALCRCGASEAKPFCDGSHKKIEFTAD